MSIAILLRLNKFILGFLLVSTSSSVYCFNVSSEILKQGSAARESFLEQLQDFKETKIESKQKEAEKIEIEQREQELEEKSSVEAKSEISREPARETVVSLEEQAEKQVVKQTAKHEEAPGIRVEQKQDILNEIYQAQDKVKEFNRLWQEAWEGRKPDETASVIFNRINRQLDLASLGDTLKFKPFELDKLENTLQKNTELKV